MFLLPSPKVKDHVLINLFPIFFYDRLNPFLCLFRQFALSLSFISIPRSYEKAILVPAWKQVMDEEMDALVSQRT